ncbi:MAG: alpha/beta hydrolase [Lachnospiraceae bacterium]|nr:alpha/beta hydrolase [Lachnospiraceae bacterium]
MNIFDEKMIRTEKEFPIFLKNELSLWVEENIKDGYFESYDGTKLHYVKAVNPEEGAAVVISHGFSEYAGKFNEMIYYFYNMGFSVFLVEHRGHALSQRFVADLENVYIKSYDEYIQDMKCFMDKIVLENSVTKKCFLFGHSMGGCISALFLEKYPQYFRAAVLSAPMLSMEVKGVPDNLLKLFMAVAAKCGFGKKIVPGLKKTEPEYDFVNSNALSEARYAYGLDEKNKVPQTVAHMATISWAAASLKAMEKLHKNADKIKTPILLFQAGLDAMVTPKGQDDFANETEYVDKVRYPKAKHEIFLSSDSDLRDYYSRIFEFFGKYIF